VSFYPTLTQALHYNKLCCITRIIYFYTYIIILFNAVIIVTYNSIIIYCKRMEKCNLQSKPLCLYRCNNSSPSYNVYSVQQSKIYICIIILYVDSYFWFDRQMTVIYIYIYIYIMHDINYKILYILGIYLFDTPPYKCVENEMAILNII